MLTVMVHGKNKYIRRFDKTVTFTDTITLYGKSIAGLFSHINVYHEFMTKHYLEKCTEVHEIVKPLDMNCYDPLLKSALSNINL